MDTPIQIPIDGTLDLHNFQPREVKDLVSEYLVECQKRGIQQVRIIHGKGMGVLQRTVHSVLGRSPGVISFQFADEGRGGWGATIVNLQKGK